MKRMVRIIAIAAALAVISGPATSGTAAASPPEIEKIVFIHYRVAPVTPAISDRAGRPGTCPDAATCTDYTWRGHKWPGGTVTYQLNANGSGVGNAQTAVAAAFAAWTTAVNAGGGSLSVSGSTGNTACSLAGSETNDVNQVCWRDLTADYPNAIAVTFVWAYRSNKQIVEADAVFNNGSGFAWGYTDPGTCDTYGSCNGATGTAGVYDVRDIGTHEFGHFLALLGDLYRSRDAQLTMYGYGATGEVKKDSLGKGDCLGITAAYGGSCP